MTTSIDFHRLMKAIVKTTEDIKDGNENLDDMEYIALVKYAYALDRLSVAVRNLASDREKLAEAKSRRTHPTTRRGIF